MTDTKERIKEAGFTDWLTYVESFEELFKQGRKLPLKQLPSQHVYRTIPSTAKVIICSPHPDDETLTGLLPLRLLQEADVEVVDLAMSLGSDPKRKEERRNELQAACSVLGFRCAVFENPPDFNEISSQGVDDDKGDWQQQIDKMLHFFEQQQPDMVLCPHAEDGHPAHAGTNRLIQKALLLYATRIDKDILFIESEFWHPLKNPNLMIGAHAEHVAKLIMALTQHRGEMFRVPYHLHLPARMMDNVRRGGELVSGYGQTGADFLFGELYRISSITKGKQLFPFGEGLICGPERALDLSLLKRNQS